MSTRTIQVMNDENIYIDCNPVNIKGTELEFDEDNNLKEEEQTTSLIDDITRDFGTGNFEDKMGPQFLIAITAFAIMYGIGNYVFKTLPNEMLDKRVNNL